MLIKKFARNARGFIYDENKSGFHNLKIDLAMIVVKSFLIGLWTSIINVTRNFR